MLIIQIANTLMFLMMLSFSLHAQTLHDVGEPAVLNKDQVKSAFISGACFRLKSLENESGDTWYLSDETGLVGFLAKDLNDAVYKKTCNDMWSGDKAGLESIKYAGPYHSSSIAKTDDPFTKYGKVFANFAIANYISSLESFDCGAPVGAGINDNDALRSPECGKSIDSHEYLLSILLPECEKGVISKDACNLINSVQIKTNTIKQKRDALIGLNN